MRDKFAETALMLLNTSLLVNQQQKVIEVMFTSSWYVSAATHVRLSGEQLIVLEILVISFSLRMKQ